MHANYPTGNGMDTVARRFFKLFLPLLLLLGVVSVFFYMKRHRVEETIIMGREAVYLNEQEKNIAARFEAIVSDLMILAKHHEFEVFFANRNDNDAREQLIREFLVFSRFKTGYDQIRFLDADGMEVIRVNKSPAGPVVVPDEGLQFKGDRYYFQETIGLAEGQIFVSPLDLNVENKEVERPFKPVIRFATPTFDSQGRGTGIVILNYLGNKFLQDLGPRTATSLHGGIMLLNSAGYWLKGARPEEEWGFMFPEGRDMTFANRYPDAWQKIIAEESGQFINQDGLISFATIYPVREARKNLGERLLSTDKGDDPGQDAYFWRIISFMPTATLHAALYPFRIRMLVVDVALLVVLTIGSWLLAGAQVRRRQLERSLRRYEQIVAASSEHMALLDRNYVYLAVNDAFLKAFNRQRGEVVGRSVADLMGAESFARIKERVDRCLAGETVRVQEEWSASAGGPVFFMDIACYPAVERDNTVSGVVLNCRDITELHEAEKKIRVLAEFPEQNPNPILRVADNGTILYANPASSYLLEKWQCATGSCLPEFLLTSFRRALETGEMVRDVETGIDDKVFSFMSVPIKETGSVYLFGQDITERKQRMLLLASVFENSIEGVTITNADAEIEQVNPAFTAITGYSADEVIGKNPRILRSGLHGPEFYREMWQAINDQGLWSGEIWNRRKNGEAYPERLSITAVKDLQGKTSHYVAVFYDITDVKRGEEQLQHQAYHDALTGLPNRQLFIDRLEVSMAYARRHRRILAVFFLDLDNFKNINDSLGYNVGDRFLQEVAGVLQECCRDEDTVARVGGDEFIMLLTEIKDERDALEVARRIENAFAEPIRVEEQEFFAGASIGITFYPADGEDAVALIKNAELAMYRAKELGRGNFQLFTERMNQEVRRRLELENSLRRALERREFEVYYQPKVSIERGTIAGAEALVRWLRNGELVSPLDFIPLAEETRLIIPIGEWVLATACQQAASWHENGHPLNVAVNLSPRQFHQDDLVEVVTRVLKETGLPAGSLELEITESIVMGDVQGAIRIMRALRDMGVCFSMDDFGTGYSSLQYLKQLPLDALKIDRAFVKDLPDNEEDAAITSATIFMAHSLGLKVVAEGVETEAQLSFLRERGCEQFQGYLFSKPVPGKTFFRYLKEGRRIKDGNLSS
ncbi:MAG: EAL domain-containing protein [Desulfobacterales bacterium]|nr:EAL domain-containing protein [Desulfobacterales bacterium]